MYKGNERQTTIEVRVDGALITTWTSSGTTWGLQSIVFTGVSGQVVELTGVLNDSEWLSIIEVLYIRQWVSLVFRVSRPCESLTSNPRLVAARCEKTHGGSWLRASALGLISSMPNRCL